MTKSDAASGTGAYRVVRRIHGFTEVTDWMVSMPDLVGEYQELERALGCEPFIESRDGDRFKLQKVEA